jgi:crotonobetainyl-CoA:carnitine CoA-transferase CaiB-like acyl-CoA transferase
MNAPGGATVFHKMTEPRIGSMLSTGLPFSVSEGRLPEPHPAPSLGAHTDEVLRDWLHMDAQAIQTLGRDGVFV